MVEEDEREYQRSARQIVNSLLQGEAPPRVPEGVSIADVERDTWDFLRLRDLHKHADQEMLVLVSPGGELAPFLYRTFFGSGFDSVVSSIRRLPWASLSLAGVPLSRRMLKESLAAVIEARRAELPPELTKVVSAEQATESFLEGATAFVRKRLRWSRQAEWGTEYPTTQLRLQMISGGGNVTATACLFTIQTNSPGLQVLWTPAYAHAQNYFGSPTTPVQAPLQAGSYRFGVLGGAYVTPQWALPVHSLPGIPYAHLPY